MELKFLGSVILIGVLASLTWWLFIQDESSHPPVIFIGIISSRYNFQRRKIIRKVWMTEMHKQPLLQARFIIGSADCMIPESLRKSPHKCEEWKVSPEDISHLKSTFTSHSLDEPVNKTLEISLGFSFRVLSPIVITEVGIFQELDGAKGTMKNLINQEIVLPVFQHKKNNSYSSESQGYHFQKLPKKYFLPANAEIALSISSELPKDLTLLGIKRKVTWKNASAIQFTSLIHFRNMQYHRFDEAFSQNAIPLMAIKFYIHSPEDILKQVGSSADVKDAFHLELKRNATMLKNEIQENSDVIIINNLRDSYDKVTLKVLALFEEALSLNPDLEYIIKCDDDVFLDASHLIQYLGHIPVGIDKRVVGHFRRNWAVHVHGKWADYDYDSVTYPPFPCGSCYAVNKIMAEWIVQNKENLQFYHGEDVSMGIWLAAVHAILHDDPERWCCDRGCSSRLAFNRVELSPMEILNTWKCFKEHNNSLILC